MYSANVSVCDVTNSTSIITRKKHMKVNNEVDSIKRLWLPTLQDQHLTCTPCADEDVALSCVVLTHTYLVTWSTCESCNF